MVSIVTENSLNLCSFSSTSLFLFLSFAKHTSQPAAKFRIKMVRRERDFLMICTDTSKLVAAVYLRRFDFPANIIGLQLAL
jgi:hypothetical protein